jgi:hypothetical protein
MSHQIYNLRACITHARTDVSLHENKSDYKELLHVMTRHLSVVGTVWRLFEQEDSLNRSRPFAPQMSLPLWWQWLHQLDVRAAVAEHLLLRWSQNRLKTKYTNQQIWNTTGYRMMQMSCQCQALVIQTFQHKHIITKVKAFYIERKYANKWVCRHCRLVFWHKKQSLGPVLPTPKRSLWLAVVVVRTPY